MVFFLFCVFYVFIITILNVGGLYEMPAAYQVQAR
jgi:hypothetical protein